MRIASPVSRVVLLAALAWPASARAQLSDTDLERLAPFAQFWESADQAVAMLALDRQRAMADATTRARDEFAGRAEDVARHFLSHTDYRARNEAYWFVLGALADPAAAILLIRALPAPPQPEQGVLPRDQGEIGIALETMMRAPAVAEHVSVAEELIKVIDARDPRAGPPDIAVGLLGRSRTVAAQAALGRLLVHEAPTVRSLAANALGHQAASGHAAPPIPLDGLVQVLERDPDPRARAEAAATLGRLAQPDGIAALDRAIENERTPQVVDAIGVALRQAGKPILDPARCRTVVERAWEPDAARLCFERWRATAGDDAIVDAALHGRPVLRILAVQALGRPVEKAPSLVRSGPAPASIHPTLRSQLLASLRELLSAPVADVSSIVPWMAQQALWDVSGQDVAVALPYVDEITPMSARYAASRELARLDPDGYARARRPRQLWSILIVAAGALLLALSPATRAAGLCLALSAGVYALWTWQATGTRDLPPPELIFLTVVAIGLFAGGAVTGLTAWATRRWRIAGPRLLLASIAAIVAAAAVALVVAGWTRATRRFPIGGEGLEMIFDPILSAALAGMWSAMLLAGLTLLRRKQGLTSGDLTIW